jgi:hypothetical protein
MPGITVRGGAGAELYFSASPLPPGIAEQIAKGDLIVIDSDVPVDDGTPDFEDHPPPGAPPLPKRADNRATWTAFAIGQGMDRDTANSMTKAELVTEFTRLRVAS